MIPKVVSRLSCAVVVGCALASTAHLLASPDEYSTSIRFAPCAEDPALDCGTLNVPIDYRKPHGKTVGLAVIRARNTNPEKRIGILFGNPGGPGVSGVDFVLNGSRLPIFARLREHFDVISFDPRGVSRSRGVACRLDVAPVPQDADDDTLAAYFDDLSRRFAQACLDQNGSFVTHLGTMNVARDIDVLRRALGERQISYGAGSYGTVLGAAYASLFPERVRAMMLDGAVAPEFRDYLAESWTEASGAFETAFRRLDDVCRRDSACRLAASGVVAAFDQVAAQLDTAPIPAPNGDRLTHDTLQGIVATLVDFERNWPLIVNALADARAGDYGLLIALLPFREGETAALAPIRCNDYGTRRPAADYLRVDEAVGGLFPRFFGRFFVASFTAPCSVWPAGEPVVVRNVRRDVETPFMIIGNDFDSRTPLRAARSLAHALGSERGLFRYAGSGHTAFFSTTACVQDTAVDYLVKLRLPREGFVCPGQPISFAASQRRTEAAASLLTIPETRPWRPRAQP
jgi:pimeloyl-ACP methyl ester carboxylesterase